MAKSSRNAKKRSLVGWVSGFLLSGLVLLSPTAKADGLADEAELHFQLGTLAYQRNDHTAALEHFMLSNRLVPNRRVIFNIARAFEQLKQYPDAHRYFVDALVGETDEPTRKTVLDAITRLAPNVAILDVVTDPPNATIYIDRSDLGSRGKSPRPLAMPAGKVLVIAALDGYETAQSEMLDVKVGTTTPVSIKLKRIVGTLDITIKGAPNASVRVGNEAAPVACTAPCKLDLPPGPQDLFVSSEGAYSPVRRINVVAKTSTPITVELRPLTGSVVVNTEETGALITLDGKPAGFTPTVIRDAPTGKRSIRVSLPGHAPVERIVLVKQGEEVDAGSFDLVPLREVTAVSRVAERIDDAPSSVSIIDGREIRAFGYPTIASALVGVRGISLTNDRAYNAAAIRAVGQPNDYGNRVLVLSDGQTLNDNLLNSSYIGSDGRGDLGDIERIEVVRGPGSLLYGAGAFSGVINLVTRSREEPTGVHVGFGSYDDSVVRGRGGFHLHFGKNGGVWASGWGANSRGIDVDIPTIEKPSPRTARGVDAFKSGGTAGRLYYGPATLQWFFHRRAQSLPIGAYQTTFGSDRSTIVDTRMMVEARFEPQLTDSLQLLIRGHANHYGFDARYAFDTGIDNVERLVGTWLGAEARLIYAPSKKIHLTLGGEGQWHPEASLRGQEETQGVASEPYLNEKRPYVFGGAYALAEGTPTPWLKLSGGVRLDVYSTFGPIFVPRGAVILKPTKGGTLKLMGGRAFRAPSIYEQLYNDKGNSTVQAGELLPEKIYSGELEYSQRFLDDWVTVTAVHGSRIDDLIETDPIAGTNTVRYANQATSVFVLGADAEIRREWRRGWMLSAMYGYQRAMYLGSSFWENRLPNVPEHLASFKGVVPMVQGLASAGLRMTLAAPRPLATGGSTNAEVVTDITVSGEVRGYGIRYAVGVYNLANRKVEVPVADTFRSRTIPLNGRTFMLDVTGTYP